jgi:hypothetical protein
MWRSQESLKESIQGDDHSSALLKNEGKCGRVTITIPLCENKDGKVRRDVSRVAITILHFEKNNAKAWRDVSMVTITIPHF